MISSTFSKPVEGETLILYFSISEYYVSGALVRKEGDNQVPKYYMINSLQDVETWYSNMEKLVYALILASRNLRLYFQAHKVEVKMAYPLRQVA